MLAMRERHGGWLVGCYLTRVRLEVMYESATSDCGYGGHYSRRVAGRTRRLRARSGEDTPELQPRSDIACRLLLLKKKKNHQHPITPSVHVRQDFNLRTTFS